MRTLFLKIFGWFWLATALVASTLIVATWTLPAAALPQPPHSYIEESADALAETAAITYDRDGRDGLRAYVARIDRPGRLHAFVFDGDGNSMLDAEVLPEAASFASRYSFDHPPRAQFSPTEIVAGGAATLADGRRILLVTVSEGGHASAIRDNLFGVFVRLRVVLVPSGLVCFALARYLTAPIVKLRRATRQVADGEFSARVGPSIGRRKDELADLARDFDVMAGRIEGLVGTQQAVRRGISHELRSPLARLGVALAIARREAGPGADEAHDRIGREAERLNGMIDQLLMIARVESEGDGADRTRIDLAALVESVAADGEFEARASNRSVACGPLASCEIRGNERLLRSAIENVVRNAVHYTAEGTAVAVDLRVVPGEGRALVIVRDHGEGVPENLLSELFRPFYRVEDARDRRSGGAGLGLAITERAIRMHGGTVRAANADGGGLAIEISLPVESDR
ncbi:MAG TPA: ATP-binding protein [Blastocatellia bacterium]|nr:ATP-binding protein [Blastocatellia bacterium]